MNSGIYKIERYKDIFREQVLVVWEKSVLATHDFLTRADFQEIKELVASIDFKDLQVYCLVNEGVLLGFVGVADRKIEMLFLDPEYIGQGLGKKLLLFAVNDLNADKLDVNEQNSKAVAFYQKFGFRTYETTEKDDQGRNYPLLRMRLSSTMVNKEKYLTRLKYSGNLEPTLEVLGKLQEAHLLHIPFENLDIYYGIPIELDIDKIYSKIILNHRGGFCYELNGLFFELLVSLGFSVRRVSARVFDKSNGYGQEYDHLAIVADIDGISYLTDVGFGEFSFSPLKLEMGISQYDTRGEFNIQKFEGDYLLVNKSENSILMPQYLFTTSARELVEFDQMCHFHQTSPESHFTRNAMITRPTQEGRITLTQDTLKIKHGDSINELHIENEETFRNMLFKYFSIEKQ